MPESSVSIGELGRRMTALSVQMLEGFSGVHKRLDRVNGRLDKHDDLLATHNTAISVQGLKIDHIEETGEQLSAHRVMSATTTTTTINESSDNITKRDLKIAVVVLVALSQGVNWVVQIFKAFTQ